MYGQKFFRARFGEGVGVGGGGGGWGGWGVELVHFNKDFFESSRKRGPAGKNFGAFSRRYL